MDELKREYLIIFLYSLPVSLLVGKLFFGSMSDFLHCLRLALTPNVISFLRGDWKEDEWATMKVYLYFTLCLGAMYSAHKYFYPS